MTLKERILFGTLIGSLTVASLTGHLLMREYGKVASDRDDLTSQLAYLLAVMAQNGLEVTVINGIATVTPAVSGEETNL